MGAEEGVGVFGIDKVGEGAAPAGDLEEGFGDEGAVAFAPFLIVLEGGGELVVEDAVVEDDGFCEIEGGGAEVAVEFHNFQFSNLNFQRRCCGLGCVARGKGLGSVFF